MKFEWNEKKDMINRAKHGISFQEAIPVFFDRMRLEYYDRKHSFLEDRWMAYGMSGCSVLRVSFLEKKGIIRIISARKANKEEEEDYLNGYGKS